jgi:hypothetical protein
MAKDPREQPRTGADRIPDDPPGRLDGDVDRIEDIEVDDDDELELDDDELKGDDLDDEDLEEV